MHQIYSEVGAKILNFPDVSYPNTLPYLGRCISSLFAPPEHPKLHIEIEDDYINRPQPLQPPVQEIVESISTTLSTLELHKPSLSNSQALALSGLLVQFSWHSSRQLPEGLTVDYTALRQLKDVFLSESLRKKAPLNFAEQFKLVMEGNGNDVFSGMVTLTLAARQYARWLDGPIITSMPKLQKTEILREMAEWRESIAACKRGSKDNKEDPAGDTYYAWTHALAQVAFASSRRRILQGNIMAGAFRIGTELMHTIVHSANKQSVPNDHRIAAYYGNMMGDCIVKAIND